MSPSVGESKRDANEPCFLTKDTPLQPTGRPRRAWLTVTRDFVNPRAAFTRAVRALTNSAPCPDQPSK